MEVGRELPQRREGYSGMALDMSLYSAKINSKEHNCFMMLVNTEFCMALTNTVT